MDFDKLTIPGWVRWLAQDSDGSWWGYSAEPHRHDTGWYENEVGDCLLLGKQPANAGWQHSLRKHPQSTSNKS